jgi:SAM-dependent methyltransferase
MGEGHPAIIAFAVTDIPPDAGRYHREFDGRLDGKYGRVADLLAGAADVLELGCATGYFSDALRARGHDVVGLEMDATAVEACRARGLIAYVADLASVDPLRAVYGRRFDAVLAMDVVEHLAWPGPLLDAVRSVIRPGGRLVVTGPNVAYWAVRLRLLFGRWTYARAGVMDETHLRWYTRRTWRELLERHGFVVSSADPAEAMLPKDAWLRKVGVSETRLDAMRLRMARWFPTLFTTVFVFVATPKEIDDAAPAADEATVRQADRLARPLGPKRSEFVRQALRQWLRTRAVERFEQEWIASLEGHPDEAARAEDWLAVQTWSRR